MARKSLTTQILLFSTEANVLIFKKLYLLWVYTMQSHHLTPIRILRENIHITKAFSLYLQKGKCFCLADGQELFSALQAPAIASFKFFRCFSSVTLYSLILINLPSAALFVFSWVYGGVQTQSWYGGYLEHVFINLNIKRKLLKEQ